MSKIEGPVGVHAFGVLDGCHSEQIDDATGSAKLQASAALKSSKVWLRGLAALAKHPHQQIGGAA